MFNQSMYVFYGNHGEIISKLTSEIDETTHFQLFKRNIDVLFIAPIVGYLYNRKDEKKSDEIASSDDNKKINYEQLQKNIDILNFNYQLIMLLDGKKQNLDIDERLNRAFRYADGTPEKEECEKIYENYILGGLLVLKEKLLDDAVRLEDYMSNMYNFINEYHNRYEKEITDSDFINLLKQN